MWRTQAKKICIVVPRDNFFFFVLTGPGPLLPSFISFCFILLLFLLLAYPSLVFLSFPVSPFLSLSFLALLPSHTAVSSPFSLPHLFLFSPCHSAFFSTTTVFLWLSCHNTPFSLSFFSPSLTLFLSLPPLSLTLSLMSPLLHLISSHLIIFPSYPPLRHFCPIIYYTIFTFRVIYYSSFLLFCFSLIPLLYIWFTCIYLLLLCIFSYMKPQ